MQKDSTYYREDGDYFVVVQSTLFKIHRFLLARDNSMFSNMFYLPDGEPNPSTEGASEDNPYHCDVESVDDFRALCWVSYALPCEIQAQEGPDVDLPRVLSLSLIANKFHFLSIEKWSISIILKHCTSASPNNYLDTCTSAELERVIKVADRADCRDLLRIIEEKWLARLSGGDFQTDLEVDIPLALEVGEKYRLKRFLGEIYYRECLKMCEAYDNTTTPPLAPQAGIQNNPTRYSPSGWNDLHLQRLFQGFYSLSLLSERLRIEGFPFQKSTNCSTHASCTSGLRLAFQTNPRLNEVKLVDVREKLRVLQGIIIMAPTRPGGQEWPTRINTGCQKEICDVANSSYEALKDTLYSHFME